MQEGKIITVLCIQEDSNYKAIDGLDLWDKNRNAYNYNGSGPIIAHPPCQQWSKLRHFAKDNKEERDLAYFCLEQVNKNGGILEHPKGSLFIKEARLKTITVWQHWWGFGAKKETQLYCKDVELLAYPISLDAIKGRVEMMARNKRSKMPIEFCQYLVNSIKNSLCN